MAIHIIMSSEIYNGNTWQVKYHEAPRPPYADQEYFYDLNNRNGFHDLLAGSGHVNFDLAKAEGFDPHLLRQSIRTERLFPKDVSNEVLTSFFEQENLNVNENDDYNPYTPQMIRHIVTKQDEENFGVSWLSLEELNSLDWRSRQYRYYGEVRTEYANLFGNGEQLWPGRKNRNDILLCSFSYPLHSKAPLSISYTSTPGYSLVSWIAEESQSFAERAGYSFIEEALPLLQTYGSPQDVRIIFWVWG